MPRKAPNSSRFGGGAPVSPSLVPYNKNCEIDHQIEVWYYNRTWFCKIDNVEIRTYITSTSQIIGRAYYAIHHAVALDVRSLTFTVWTYIHLQGQSGSDPALLVHSQNDVSGSWGTKTYGEPWAGYKEAQNLTVASNDLNDSMGPEEIHNNLIMRWTDSFTTPDSLYPATLNYKSPIPIRCDSQSNVNGNPGCSVPQYTPTLVLTGFETGNAGTANVAGMQYFNMDHWGRYPDGTVLHRLNNSTQATANRRAMCQSGYWTANSAVLGDSCDEFPFAASYESGNMLGLAPTDCSEWIPIFDPSTLSWIFDPYPGYSTSQRCVLGHVNLNDNQSVGGMYSAFIQNKRIINNDAFWIGFRD